MWAKKNLSSFSSSSNKKSADANKACEEKQTTTTTTRKPCIHKGAHASVAAQLEQEKGSTCRDFKSQIRHPDANVSNKCAAKSKGEFNMESITTKLADPVCNSEHKVTVIGCGAVGMACAFSILTKVTLFFFFNF